MTYDELKQVMTNYRLGRASRAEMTAAIALWQVTEGGMSCARR